MALESRAILAEASAEQHAWLAQAPGRRLHASLQLCSTIPHEHATSCTFGIIPELDALARSSESSDALMNAVAALLFDRLGHYNWVGFYMLEKEAGGDVLVLGPFKGAPTPHTRIPLNQGICGAAMTAGRTIVVDDVSSDPRYLACSLETKSEIVVPVFVNGKVAGELDIDSHSLGAFGAEDRELCEHAAAIVGRYLELRSR